MRPGPHHPQGEIHVHSVKEVVCPAGNRREIHRLTSDDVIISVGPLDNESVVASFSLPPPGPDGTIPDCSQSIHCSDCPRPEGCIVINRERL